MKLLLGLDLTEVDRVARLLDRWGDRFVNRVFLPGEISARRRHPRARAEHVAGRFAAKEAAMKALGTGTRGVAFREIEVKPDPRGKPTLTLHGRALDRARRLNVKSMEVSITHGQTTAAAVVAFLTGD
ncbi:MAG TPA: holo-ACP synthase [Thermoanaerobaculia bacterium]|nr:holo-ACP synthase [Thermoanaerobaculia bacterium]